MSRWTDDLERELRESPIPAHRPDHFERIRERMAQAPRPAAAVAASPEPPATPASRRLLVRVAALATIAAAVVAAIAVTWTGLPGLGASAPPAATADTVLRSVQQALAGLTSIRGDVVEYGSVRGRPYAHKVGSFAFTSEGDYRIVQTDLRTVYTYDSRSGVAYRYTLQDGQVAYGEVARHLPDPGPFFSPWMGVSQVLDRSVAAYARAVIGDLDPDVPAIPIRYEGRTAWQITVPAPLVGGGQNGSTRIVVDAASGYPLVVERWSADDEVSGTRIEKLRVGGAIGRGLFSVRPEVATRLVPLSERYVRLTEDGARRLAAEVPFSPLAPGWLPRGYVLGGITGAVNGAVMGRYTAASSPGSTDSVTVVFTYRRGFDRFCVVSRWRRSNPPGSDDPFDEDAVASTAVRTTLTEGALAGSPARLVLGLPDWPHLYASTGADRHVSVSVAGDLTRAELLRIAASLRPLQP